MDNKGYIKICIRGVRYGAHQLAWFYVYGFWIMPDHRDDIPYNNAIANLRPATYTQNNHKKKVYNPLGHKGVRFRSGCYEAHIRVDGKVTRIYKGESLEEASNAYKAVARELYGEYANE